MGDLSLAAASWLAAYGIRFSGYLPTPKGLPPLSTYLLVLIPLLPIWVCVLWQRGLYESRTAESPFYEVIPTLQATTSVIVLLVGLGFFLERELLSRGVILLFWILSSTSVLAFHGLARKVLRVLHRRGQFELPALVVGAGELADVVIERIRSHPETGVRVVGLVTDSPGQRELRGLPVVGSPNDLKGILAACGASEVIIALCRGEGPPPGELFAELEQLPVNVHLVPEWFDVLTLRISLEDLDGLPVISIRESPLVGWAALAKRLFDAVVSGSLLLLTAPLTVGIVVALWMTSGRPIFYRQARMGLDGHLFQIVKFRTMTRDAESQSGAVWAGAGDPRRTRFGRLLRRISLDELPQLWNVLRGDMSLVGPRPERPVFVERFRDEIPSYMMRHRVKAGMTGWAQVHRWRGDTSLQERLEHDLYYVRNWSLSLDIRILLMTLWRLREPR